MVDNLPTNKKNNNRFPFKGVIVDQDSTEKRRVARLLPGVNQTQTMQKFLSAGADHLFEPGSSKPINGYVGQRPPYYDARQDYYLEESTAVRRFYQMEPSMTSRTGGASSVDSLLTYDDLINQLRFQGGLVNNHHRLFEQEYYTWCPPIDLDKFLNFREYYWLPEGAPPVPMLGHVKASKGDGTTQSFPLPPSSAIGAADYSSLSSKFIRVVVDGVTVPFTYPSGDLNFVRVNRVPVRGSDVRVYVRSNFVEDILDTVRASASWGISITSNVRIQVLNDADTSINGRIYIVENVGEGRTPIILEDTVTAGDGDELVVNGGFEYGPGAPFGTFVTLSKGDTSLSGWSITRGSVDVKHGYFQVIEGKYDLDLSGNEAGAIEQYLNTTAGTTYTLSFLLAGNPDQNSIGNTVHTVRVTTGDDENRFVFNSANQTRTNMGWVTKTVTFTAKTTRTLLRFDSVENTPCGVVLDRVSVTRTGTNTDILSARPDYLIMARGCRDGNPWSRGNRWFHQSVVGALGAEKRDVQAKRPIVEFQRNLELHNYGLDRRPKVHLLSDDIPDIIVAVTNRGSVSKNIDGIDVTVEWINENIPDKRLRVLVTGDRNPAVNNRVYQITPRGDRLAISLVADGLDVSGAPAEGEVIGITLGRLYGNKDMYWDGTSWNFTQIKRSENQAPLFQLYDYDGVRLQDAGRYPGSSFRGNALFGYQPDATASRAVDPVLGFPLVHSSKGEIEFENFLATQTYTYRSNGRDVPILSYGFHRTQDSEVSTYGNDWFAVGNASRQMVVDTFEANGNSRLFTLSQAPAPQRDGALANLTVQRNSTMLVEGKDYIRQNNQIIITELAKGDRIEARTFNPLNKSGESPGFYEVPLNLKANPGSQELQTVTKGEVYNHFTEIMRNQRGFQGVEFSNNNWRDTPQERNLGTGIVQHSAPLLRTMLMAAQRNLDFMSASRFAEAEYARFRAKFDQKIHEFILLGKFRDDDDVELWVDAALDALTRGYTQEFPFYHSGVAATAARPDRNFIPETPSFLGIYPQWVPTTQVENSVTYLVGHDGSRTPAYGDFRDTAVLALENRIFNSIEERVLAEERPLFDYIHYVSGRYRTADYSREEFQLLLRPMFERWCATNSVDYKTNSGFQADDPFTWNWSSVRSRDNRVLPGNWRGIYTMYYDTTRPHTHPWEMLGFTDRPAWWDLRYGGAPYTRDNSILWDDLEQGRIFSGARATLSDPRWARPGLRSVIPVGAGGELLDPQAAGITAGVPTGSQARQDWQWGDHAPAEAAWHRSHWYPFAVAQASYLMKPARFVEAAWDSINRIRVLVGTPGEQLISRYSGRRDQYSSEYVHAETTPQGDLIKRVGIQQWMSDLLISQGKNVTENFGRYVRGLDAQLVYKVGGFTDDKSLLVVSDSFDRVPSEDVVVELYRSPSVREEFYGGVIVEKTAQGWKIYGFDIADPVFRVLPPDRNGNSISVSSGSRGVGKIPGWAVDTYYSVNATVSFADHFYRCIRTHTSSKTFEQDFWKEVARPDVGNPFTVEYYVDPLNVGYVERLPYGNIIRTAQEMAEFFGSYERYLVSRGWVFDQVVPGEQTINDWRNATKDFLAWSRTPDLPVGAFLALSPMAGRVKFHAEHGTVAPVEQVINGVYSILDRTGSPIAPQSTNVIRDNDVITIVPVGKQQIFACRLYVSEVEHVIVFNNTTIFKDIIYSPLLNIRQPRLRLQGFKTRDWHGRVDAPGFLVTGNTLTPNFEKTADDFRRFFEIEGVENSELKARARANTGYSEKEYLNNLLMTPTNQFEFYQAAIQQKGTASAFKRILRSNFIRHNDGLQFLEEWAFRVGDYGAANIRPTLDVKLRQKDVLNNPQLIRFNGLFVDHNRVETASQLYSINGITSTRVAVRGAGYQTPPTIVATAAQGMGARLAPVMDWSNSSVSAVSVINGGSGFVVGDVLQLEGSGLGAAVVVDQVDYTRSVLLTVSLELPEGATGAGAGYKVGTIVYVDGGNGRGKARVQAVDSKGGITEVRITTPGGNYDPSRLGFSFDGFNQSAAPFLRATVSNGAARTCRVISGGRGYDNSTACRSPRTTLDATFAVSITGGSLAGVDIVEPGSGYITGPRLTVSGGKPTTPAQAIALVSNAPVPVDILLQDFGSPQFAEIRSLSVQVLVPFNGTQPLLSVGDGALNTRYMNTVTLAGKTAFKITLNTDNARVLNEGAQLFMYLSNTSTQGSLRVSVEYSNTAAFYQDTVDGTTQDNIIDVTDVFARSNGEYLYRDDRWVQRYASQQPDWPTRVRALKEKGNLPNAGYVHLTDVEWTTTNWQQFLNLYRDRQDISPDTFYTETLDLRYVEALPDHPPIRRHTLVSGLRDGVYSILKFTLNIEQGYPFEPGATPTISIGDATNPTRWVGVTDATVIQNTEFLINEFVRQGDLQDDSIYVYVDQKTNLNAHPGRIVVLADMDLIGDSVLPGHRAWCYDTGIGDWSAFRLGDSGANVAATYPGSFYGQGTVVATNRDMFPLLNIPHDILNPSTSVAQAEQRMPRVVLNNVENVFPNLQGTYSTKFRNRRKIFFDASSLDSGNGNPQALTPIMDLFANTGIVINRFTVGVIREFTNTVGRNPTLSIGTPSEPDRWVKALAHNTKTGGGAPVRPTFDYADPIVVNFASDEIRIDESQNTRVNIIRSGNIFVTPTSIRVLNGGWGYAQDSAPRVVVLGPTGVQATANITGRVAGYAVVSGGDGYGSNTALAVVGGGGSGAQGRVRVEDGRIVAVDIPGTGTGTGTVTMAGTKVAAVSVTGKDWQYPPIVRLVGGTPARHATVSSKLTDGVLAVDQLLDAGSDYRGIPTVVLQAYTGDNYTGVPRVIVSDGSGQGAIIEPIMIWSVSSITITNWGKCSWTGENGSIVVEPPRDGAAAVAELLQSPKPNIPTSIRQYRYRVVSPADNDAFNVWQYVGNAGTETVKFPAPTDSNDPQYWLQTVEIPTGYVDGATTFQVEIPAFVYDTQGKVTDLVNVNHGAVGDINLTYVSVNNTIEGSKDIDLTRIYVKYIDINERITGNEQMVALFDPDGVTDGLISVLVDYHYVSGFETYDVDVGSASFSTTRGKGGDVLTWDCIRFANRDRLTDPHWFPADGWQLGDLALMDDGRTNPERARVWNADQVFNYHDLTAYNGSIYRSLKGGSGAIATVSLLDGSAKFTTLVDNGSPYTGTPVVSVEGNGFGMVLKALLRQTRLAHIVVKSGGKNYQGTELISISGGGGENALARISKVVNGVIISVDLISPGYAFTGSPDVVVQDDYREGEELVQLEAILEPSLIDAIVIEDVGNAYDRASISIASVKTSVPFLAQEWELASEELPQWRTLTYAARTPVSKEWQEVRRETPMVDSDLVESATIYNIHTQETEQTLQLYDPFKGIIPGIAEKEIDYILEYDPAIYSAGNPNTHVIDANQNWGRAQQGLLWWDLSTVRYLDYEISDADYKWRNWGKLCPGVSVDVYEWTRSTTPPSNWENVVRNAANLNIESNGTKPTGDVKDINLPGYSEQVEYNSDLGRDETVYYFWVQNVATVPPLEHRTLSSIQVASVIADPTNQDIAWFAVIEQDKIIVGGIKQYLNDKDTVLKVKWKLGHSDGNYHKQWILMREGDERNNIDPRLWNKMRDSLVGWDSNTAAFTTQTVTTTGLNSVAGTMTLENADGFSLWGEVLVNGVWFSYEYRHGNTLYGVRNPGEQVILAGATVSQNQSYADPRLVPGEWLSDVESYGTLSRPRQTWFRQDSDTNGVARPSRDARKIFVDTLNTIFAREPIMDTRYEWSNVFTSGEPVPQPNEYSYDAPDLFYRDQLVATNTIRPGQRVFLNGLDDTQGFWTLWRYEPDQPDSDGAGYVLERAQRWRLQENELWEARDWYAKGWSSADFPVRRFVDRAARDAAGRLDITLLKGTLVRCDRQNDLDPRWSWSIFTENGWQDVAKGHSTIYLKDAFWQDSSVLYGYNSFFLNRIANRDGSWELAWLADQLKIKLLTPLERNELFFSMVQAAQSQHTFVDWSFKTSFLYLAGYKEELKQSPIAHKDQIDNLLAYVEEVKPYHVKVRDFVRRLATDIDLANFRVTDFDKPLYFDKTLDNGAGAWRKLNPSSAVDVEILSTQLPYKDWWTNYNRSNYDLANWNDQWNPIRRPKVSILLDRISCAPIGGWDPKEMPWDSTEERWRGNGTLRSFADLSSRYRKYSPLIADWRTYYSDYVVHVVDPRSQPSYVYRDERQTVDTRDDTNRVNFERILWESEAALNSLVVIANPDAPDRLLSVWRCKGIPEERNEAAYADVYRPNFHDYWERFTFRALTLLDEESRDDYLRESQRIVNSGGQPIVQTGDVVNLINSTDNYVWSGDTWEIFWSLKWDTNYGGGLADRIDRFYVPDATQKRKELNELIRGCDFRGTLVDGGHMEQGLWDMFAWDFEGGWANEFDYYVGRDVELNASTDELEQQQYALHSGESNWSLDETGMEYLQFPAGAIVYINPGPDQVLVSGGADRIYRNTTTDQYGQIISDPEDQRGLFIVYDKLGKPVLENGKPVMEVKSLAMDTDIVLDGNEFNQPGVDGGHPDELMRLRVRNPLMLTVYQNGAPGSKPAVKQATAFRLFKNGTDIWEAGYLVDSGITLAQDLTPFAREVVLHSNTDLLSTAATHLHNPDEPQDAVFDRVALNQLYHFTERDAQGKLVRKPAGAGDWTLRYRAKDLLEMFTGETLDPAMRDPTSPQYRVEVARAFARLYADFSEGSSVWFKAAESSRFTDDPDLTIPSRKGKMRGVVALCELNSDYTQATVTVRVAPEGVREAGTSAHWGMVPEFKLQEPGSIWIRGERINYRKMVRVDGTNNYVLKYVTRGAGGTSYATTQSAGTPVYDASVLHRLSLGDNARYPVNESVQTLQDRRTDWNTAMNADAPAPTR